MRRVIFAAAFGLLLVAGAADAAEADVIAAVGGDARAPGWDAAVANAITDAYDADHSGAIQAPAELRAVPCAVWSALDRSVRAAWGGVGLRWIYGTRHRMLWMGSALGFDMRLHRRVDRAAERCGVE